MASIFKHALFKPYLLKSHGWWGDEPFLTPILTNQSKNHWWQGCKPFLKTVLTNQPWKTLVARWQAYPNRLSLIYEFKISWWRGGKPLMTLALKNHSWKSLVASIFKQALFEPYESKIHCLRGGEPVLIQALTNQSWKSLVARWRAYSSRLSLKNMNSKFPGGEVASHFWH